MAGRRGVLLGLVALAGCRGAQDPAGESVLAWRFVGTEDDANRPIARSTDWTHFDGPLELAFSGMVGSERPLDALFLGFGNVVTRIELRTELQRAPQRLVARSQRLLWRAEAGAALMAFARAEALSVAALWSAPEPVLRSLRTPDPALSDEAFELAFAHGSPAARAAMMALAPDTDERAWQNAFAALEHVIEAREAARVSPAGEDSGSVALDEAPGTERDQVDARLGAHLEVLAKG